MLTFAPGIDLMVPVVKEINTYWSFINLMAAFWVVFMLRVIR